MFKLMFLSRNSLLRDESNSFWTIATLFFFAPTFRDSVTRDETIVTLKKKEFSLNKHKRNS